MRQKGNDLGLGEASLIQQELKKISKDQVDQYEKDGYFVVKGLFSQGEIDVFRNRFSKLCKNEVDRQSMTLMRDIDLAKNSSKKTVYTENEVTKIQDWQEDEVLMKYVCDSKIIEVVSDLIGKNFRSIHTMLINKPPDLGNKTSRHPVHQDLLYFPLRPANKIVAAWTAMQSIDTSNGCLFVVPGSHKHGLLPHSLPEGMNRAYQEIQNSSLDKYETSEKVLLHMEVGDTVFFHPCLWHGSGPNQSTRFRKAISCHYASTVCDFIDLPSLAHNLLDELFATKKLLLSDKNGVGAGMSYQSKNLVYQEAWRAKSRHVSGIEMSHWELDFNKLIEAGISLEPLAKL